MKLKSKDFNIQYVHTSDGKPITAWFEPRQDMLAVAEGSDSLETAAKILVGQYAVEGGKGTTVIVQYRGDLGLFSTDRQCSNECAG